MSGKRAKEKRKQEKEKQKEEAPDLGNHLFDFTLHIYDTGLFSFSAPEGASIPLALDCMMRCSHYLWGTIVKRMMGPKQSPLVVPGTKGTIDMLEAIKRHNQKMGG